jgi:putative transposase
MKHKRRNMEEIIRIIRQADGGQTVREVCREHNVHEVTFHRWKRKYGGLKLDDAQKLKGLEKERESNQEPEPPSREEQASIDAGREFAREHFPRSTPPLPSNI